LIFQSSAILRGAEKAVVFDTFRRDVMGPEHRQQGDANGSDIALAAAFSHESTAGLECPVYTSENGVVIAHPVQGGIREDGIEFLVEG
jgi:hypothetical protein